MDRRTDRQTQEHGHEANWCLCDYSKAPKSLYKKINSLSLPNMVMVVKMSINWVCSTHWGTFNAYGMLVQKCQSDHLQDLILDGRIALILKLTVIRVRAGRPKTRGSFPGRSK